MARNHPGGRRRRVRRSIRRYGGEERIQARDDRAVRRNSRVLHTRADVPFRLRDVAREDVAWLTRGADTRFVVVVTAIEIEQQAADRLGVDFKLGAADVGRLAHGDVPVRVAVVAALPGGRDPGWIRRSQGAGGALEAGICRIADFVVLVEPGEVHTQAAIEELRLEAELVVGELLAREWRYLVLRGRMDVQSWWA